MTILTLFWLFHIHILKFQIWSHQMSHMIRWCYLRWQHYSPLHFPPILRAIQFWMRPLPPPLQFSVKFGQIKCWRLLRDRRPLWEILDPLLTLLRKLQKINLIFLCRSTTESCVYWWIQGGTRDAHTPLGPIFHFYEVLEESWPTY